MQNYFTSIEAIDDGYVGILYEKNTNRQAYKTQKHFSQSQAIKEINNYILSNQATNQQSAMINSVKMQPVPPAPGRCCGR